MEAVNQFFTLRIQVKKKKSGAELKIMMLLKTREATKTQLNKEIKK